MLPNIRLNFSSKRVNTSILPPMTLNGPICNRKYTIYYSPITYEYFLTIWDNYCEKDLNPILKNEVYAKWDIVCNGTYRLNLYVNLGNENNLLIMARYALYKQLIPNYIRSILHGDRFLFRENRCLLNTLVTVRFISNCEKMNMVEPYGSLKNFR